MKLLVIMLCRNTGNYIIVIVHTSI